MSACAGHDVVIVGASLAGLRVAEALRRAGYDGRLRLVGDERHLPYDRPPLSKQVLTGEWDAERAALTTPEKLSEAGIELLLGRRAVGATSSAVTLDDGTELAFDDLVVATGATARTWPGTTPGSGRVHRLRTLDDATRLRAALDGDGDLVVVGGGFIGLEVAAAARKRGQRVTVVEQAGAPLEPILGPMVGAFFTRLHEAEGVSVRTGTAITAVEEDAETVLVRVADGTALAADHVVVGIGATPNNQWLAGLGLDGPGGVPCDATGRAADRIWALGDVAQWDEPAYATWDSGPVRHEHWTTAVDQAAVVAAALVGSTPTRPHELPYFWSMQYDVNFQLVGRPDLATSMEVLEPGEGGADRGTVFGFRRDGRLVAVGTFHHPRRFLRLRRELQQQLTASLVNA